MAVILTFTDGSSYAQSIYQHAAWAASRLGGGIEVLHVVEHQREHSPAFDLSGAIGFDATAELAEELTIIEESRSKVARLRGKAILEDARQRFLSMGLDGIEFTQRHGTVEEALGESESRAELVVIGKRGEHDCGIESPLGGHLEELVRLSAHPVLVASRAFQPINKFLIAFDNSPSARKAVSYVAESPLLRGFDCHLVMAGRTDTRLESALRGARDELARAGFTVTAQSKPGNAAAVIAETVRSGGIELLIMGAYGHSHIREFIAGSTTTKMVRSCAIPVLMFR
jgi:nucleotide-binding universal stress UspA family protein